MIEGIFVVMEHNSAARSEPIACPICGRALARTTSGWLAAFECDRCGQFTDFDGALSSTVDGRRSPQVPSAVRPALPGSPSAARRTTAGPPYP